jgi:hypothetical protein
MPAIADAGSSYIDGAFQAEAHVCQSIGDDTFTVLDTPPARFGHHRMPEGFGALKIVAPEGNLMIMSQMPPLPRANNLFIARFAGRLSP